MSRLPNAPFLINWLNFRISIIGFIYCGGCFMSYEILYDKQFIKLGEKYLPMILSGSSNMWDVNGARERSWSNFQHILRCSQDNYCASADEIIQAANKDIADGEEKGYFEMFFKNGRPLTPNQYLNVFKIAIKQALTVEQLTQEGVYLEVVLASGKRKYINSSFELEMLLKDNDEVLIDDKPVLGFRLNADAKGVVKLRKAFFPRKIVPKTKKVFNSYFVIKSLKVGAYIIKKRKRGFEYHYDYDCWLVKTFPTRAKARKYSMRLGEQSDFEVVEINQDKEFLVAA